MISILQESSWRLLTDTECAWYRMWILMNTASIWIWRWVLVSVVIKIFDRSLIFKNFCCFFDSIASTCVLHVYTSCLDPDSRCKWSANAGEPLLFVKYDGDQLSIIDTQKQTFALKRPIQIERDRGSNNYITINESFSLFLKGVWLYSNLLLSFLCVFFSLVSIFFLERMCCWIDSCPNDGNLLATGGSDKNIKIFDKRASKIVKTFEIHSGMLPWFNIAFLTVELLLIGMINCVRWSPDGGMLASASVDKTVKMLDFKTGKTLYTGFTSYESNLR